MIPDIAPTVEDHEQIRAALIAAIAESSKTDIELSVVKTERDTLRAERDTLKTQHAEAAAEVEKLHNLVEQLRRTLYGSRSEKLDPDQLQLAFEDLEQAIGTAKAADEAATPREKRARRPGTSEPHRNRGTLPANLPRIDVTIDVEDKTCPCCGGELHAMGEDVREMLDIVPPQLRVKAVHTPKYACRRCEEGVVQAPAPERPITGGMATEALLAYIIISKFCDHLPLYRQAQIFARLGITLDRSTLADWVGRTAWWLRPLYDLLVTTVLSSPKLFAR